jgi:hypothetical protein
VQSQFPRPHDSVSEDYEKVLLPSRNILSIIYEYGIPYYIKIDIEHYDAAILKTLFQNDIRPPFISAESHSVEIFSLLVSLGDYKAFKLVDGHTVSEKYKNYPIGSNGKKELYSFPYHSAGPFGEDVLGEWMTADNFLYLLAYEQLGWKDIHATNIVQPNIIARPSLKTYVQRAIKYKLLRGIKLPINRFIDPTL